MFPRNGQSLVEILVGIGLGVVFIVGAVALIAPLLRTDTEVGQVQETAQLANELAGNVQAWAEGNWNSVLALATSSVNTYYLNATTSPFSAVTGTETVAVGTSTYSRYFYLNDIYRDANGNVTTTASGNNYDPSTKQVAIVVQSSSTSPFTYTMYIARTVNSAYDQTSWVGGSGQSVPVKIVGTMYATSSDISISATGSIELLSVSNACLY